MSHLVNVQSFKILMKGKNGLIGWTCQVCSPLPYIFASRIFRESKDEALLTCNTEKDKDVCLHSRTADINERAET